MKRILLILLSIGLMAGPVYAETLLTTPEVIPDFDRFRINKVEIDLSAPEIHFYCQFGHQVEGAFVKLKAVKVRISNSSVFRDRELIVAMDANDEFPSFPVAYQETPATVILGEMNGGGFGGQDTLNQYAELIVKTLLGL